MSYDISLYTPAFLRRAVDEQLGDWTDADPLPPTAVELAVSWLASHGYVLEFEHPRFGRTFRHANNAWGLQVSIFQGSISFAVPYWDDAVNAIIAAKSDADELAALSGLAIHDPQTGDLQPE